MIRLKNIKQKIKITISILLIICVFVFGRYYSQKRYDDLKVDPSQNAMDCIEIIPEQIVYLDEVGLSNFTATGFTYDSTTDTFWIADHGTNSNDKVQLIQISSDFSTVVSIVQVGDYINDGVNSLQGIAYNRQSDSILCAMGEKIIEVNKRGGVISSYTHDLIRKNRANGICIDEQDNSIWILCFDNVLLHFDASFILIDSFDINYWDQDMIVSNGEFLYFTVGADYQGDNNFIVSFNKKTHEIKTEYRVLQSYAIEGVVVLDGKILVMNDGLFHKAAIPKTYISVYEGHISK